MGIGHQLSFAFSGSEINGYVILLDFYEKAVVRPAGICYENVWPSRRSIEAFINACLRLGEQ